MKKRIITMAVAMGCLVTLGTGELYAAGRGNGGHGQRNGARANRNAACDCVAATRPADSQRRDGTFLTTGTTANGSTTRPENGTGLQDGSHLNTAPTVPAPAQ